MPPCAVQWDTTVTEELHYARLLDSIARDWDIDGFIDAAEPPLGFMPYEHQHLGDTLRFYRMLPATLKALLMAPFWVPEAGFLLMSPHIKLTHLSMFSIHSDIFSFVPFAYHLERIEWISFLGGLPSVQTPLIRIAPRLRTFVTALPPSNGRVRQHGLRGVAIVKIPHNEIPTVCTQSFE